MNIWKSWTTLVAFRVRRDAGHVRSSISVTQRKSPLHQRFQWNRGFWLKEAKNVKRFCDIFAARESFSPLYPTHFQRAYLCENNLTTLNSLLPPIIDRC